MDVLFDSSGRHRMRASMPHATYKYNAQRRAACNLQMQRATYNVQQPTGSMQHIHCQPSHVRRRTRTDGAQPSPGGLAEQAGGGAPTEAEEFCAARLSTVLPSLGGGRARVVPYNVLQHSPACCDGAEL